MTKRLVNLFGSAGLILAIVSFVLFSISNFLQTSKYDYELARFELELACELTNLTGAAAFIASLFLILCAILFWLKKMEK